MVFLRNMKRCPRTCIFGKRGLWARREVELLWPWESCACFFCQTFQIPGWEQDWTNPRRLHWLGGLPSLCSHLQDMTPDSGTCRQNTIVPHKYVQGWVIYNWGTKKKNNNYNRDKDILLKKKKKQPNIPVRRTVSLDINQLLTAQWILFEQMRRGVGKMI